MRLMTIVGSPRRGGNTEILTDKVIEGFKSCGHGDVQKIFILDKKIEYCTGCLSCLFPKRTGKCVIDDDMEQILDEMRGQDAFLFATPNHQHTVSAPMLNFLSRMLPLLDYDPHLNSKGELISRDFFSDIQGKRVGVVGSQGDPYLSSSLVLPLLDKIFDDCKLMKIGDFISLGNIGKKEVLEKKGDLQKVFELGVKLANSLLL